VSHGSIPWFALGAALALLGGVAVAGCGATAPSRAHVTPADEARHRVRLLRERGGAMTAEEVAWVASLPYRPSGLTDIDRALREGIPAPSVPLGERRRLLERAGGDNGGGAEEAADASTGEDPNVDPQR
jgi:hypothetical protein